MGGDTPLKDRYDVFERALVTLEEVLAMERDDVVRDSIIKRFEYTYEAAWKAIRHDLRRALSPSAIDGLPRKELYRRAARAGLFDSPDSWFGYHDDRNATAHTYDDELATEVVGRIERFAPDARIVLGRLRAREAALHDGGGEGGGAEETPPPLP